MSRAEGIRHDEVKALANGGRRIVPEQRFGAGTPPLNGPVRIGDDDGVIGHIIYLAPRQNSVRTIRIWPLST